MQRAGEKGMFGPWPAVHGALTHTTPGKPLGVQRRRPRREMDGSEGGCAVQLARQDENLGSWVSRLYANLQVSIPRRG